MVQSLEGKGSLGNLSRRLYCIYFLLILVFLSAWRSRKSKGGRPQMRGSWVKGFIGGDNAAGGGMLSKSHMISDDLVCVITWIYRVHTCSESTWVLSYLHRLLSPSFIPLTFESNFLQLYLLLLPSCILHFSHLYSTLFSLPPLTASPLSPGAIKTR